MTLRESYCSHFYYCSGYIFNSENVHHSKSSLFLSPKCMGSKFQKKISLGRIKNSE